jgi:uncharacterized protein (DUF2147 family)
MKKITLSIACLIITFVAFAQSGTDAILGTYLSQSGKGKIQIFKAGSTYAGKLVWLKEPNDATTNTPKTDKENPNKAKQSQPILGLIILTGLKFTQDGKWENGKIYDPNTGKTWDCDATLNDNQLKLKGYWKTTWFGRTEVWTRVP